MDNTTILVVEDEYAVARGLEYGLSSEGFTVLLAETGQRALDLVRASSPDLVVLDIRLPDMSGFDVCSRIRAQGERLPILMLTARDEEVDKVLGLELGADDYVVKPYSMRELISRIRALLRRTYGDLAGAAVGDRVVFGQIRVDLERLSVSRLGQPISLTPTEFRLLRYMLANPSRPLTRETIIQSVWGYDSGIGDERTVDVHIRHLREKLEDDPANPRWLLTVRGVGYKFEP